LGKTVTPSVNVKFVENLLNKITSGKTATPSAFSSLYSYFRYFAEKPSFLSFLE
jgi:hypothetical protein